ncbi:MAG: hypothetical protein BGN86_10365 [Caulobacterales bacterium 68-7]|nr:hypothetical protein [Caulobacterales bacterium]OJU09635.1 MAG: hypothetical protein BGN86_10365 [Caulobacterales bacterium 68-7]
MDDATLKALLADNDLPERDPAFRLAVMQGVARRRFIGELLDLAPFVAGAAALLWLLAPQIEVYLRRVDFGLLGSLTVALVIVASLLAPTGLLTFRRMTET